jgi:hypothetical protein
MANKEMKPKKLGYKKIKGKREAEERTNKENGIMYNTANKI